ncbi:MAG: rRNA maturation RNase YbeY [Dongiaceae bacterium]
MTLAIDIAATAAWKKALPQYKAIVRRAAQATLKALRLPPAEISIVLTNNAQVQKLNRLYRGQDKPTNVLSFPQVSGGNIAMDKKHKPPLPLGDVVIAYPYAAREAKAQGKSLRAHTIHLLIHGILHLLGYDHGRAQEAKQMENLEKKILRQFGIKNPYEVSHG